MKSENRPDSDKREKKGSCLRKLARGIKKGIVKGGDLWNSVIFGSDVKKGGWGY